jgi:hypothetical protein
MKRLERLVADGRITEYWTLSKEVDAFGRWGRSLAP